MQYGWSPRGKPHETEPLTYSPELNLIEIVWKQAKYHWRRFMTWTQETMEEEINALVGRLR
ncbi:hypothetical protein PSI15_12175 [Xenorhabdus sp. PR6a]|uniref:transposase n=1 Tax=Xenorhabdus sp. PR6a TaxID=3025877 RepID=UPI0023585988|nr:transposase [Xenorhabdus sp. PR6a]MDC9582311.1 hypothetical protein [Xenorhabdus sp. PR6a]